MSSSVHKSENRPKPKRRAPRSAYRKGQSGNPGGRPKAAEANVIIRDLFKANGEDVIRRLYALCKSKDKRVSLAAINSLLDRVMGRPNQAMEIKSTEIPPTTAQLVGELRKILIAKNPQLVEALAAAVGDCDD